MSTIHIPDVAVAREPSRLERAAVRVVQIGAIACVLVASTYRAFDLDRFFVPKELVLHLTAAIVGLLLLASVRRIETTRVDLLLLGFLGAGAVSGLLATNPWAAQRALAINLSGILLFWSARALRAAGLGRAVVVGVGLAAVAAAGSCLLQAYGVTTDLFTPNRSPGGTLGNRNFVAHLVAFSFPVLLLSALRAWRGLGFLIGSAGAAVALWALILTRSRAAWLGLVVVLAIFAAASLLCRPTRRNRRLLGRTAVIVLLAGGGVAGALLLPNSLEWRSDSPYLETARGVVNYREGSGRGRLIQYRTSLAILANRPLLGAGPGNWQVHYPAHAADDDPSLDRSQPGTTANPWPSSDWVAYLTERGLLGAGLFALALLGIATASWRRLRTARDAEEGLEAVTCLALLGGTATVGAFDAVMLLAWPTLLVWASLGVLWTPEVARPARTPPWSRSAVVGILSLVAVAATVRSTGQLAAMAIFAGEPGRSGLERAAALDPGNFRVRLGAARSYRAGEEHRCRHALTATRQFPASGAARTLARGCD